MTDPTRTVPRKEVGERWMWEEGAPMPSPGSLAEGPKYPCCGSRESYLGCAMSTHREDKKGRYHATPTEVGARSEIDFTRFDWGLLY